MSMQFSKGIKKFECQSEPPKFHEKKHKQSK